MKIVGDRIWEKIMIIPSGLVDVDVEKVSDEDIVAAYLADGFDEESAQGYLGVLRGNFPD